MSDVEEIQRGPSPTTTAFTISDDEVEEIGASSTSKIMRKRSQVIKPYVRLSASDKIVAKIRRHFRASKNENERFKWIAKIPMIEELKHLEPNTLLQRFTRPRERLYTLLVAGAAFYNHFEMKHVVQVAKAVDAIASLTGKKTLEYFIGGSYPAYIKGYISAFEDVDIFVLVPKEVSSNRHNELWERLAWYSYHPYNSSIFAKTDVEKSARQAAELFDELDASTKDVHKVPYSLFNVFNSAGSPFQVIVVNEVSVDRYNMDEKIIMKTPVDVVEQFDLQIIQGGVSNISGEFHIRTANPHDPATDTDPRRTERRRRYEERIRQASDVTDAGKATLWNQLC